MPSAAFGYLQSSPTTSNAIPTASSPTKSAEKLLAARRIALIADMMHPINKNLSFVLFVILQPLDGYFHLASMSSLQKMALETKKSSTSTTSNAAKIISKLLVSPRSPRSIFWESYQPWVGDSTSTFTA